MTNNAPSTNRPQWPFLVASGLAGALAVPLGAVASPVATLAAAVAGFLGLRLWRWSGLPGALKTKPMGRFERIARPMAAFAVGIILGLLLLGVIRLAIEPRAPAVGARIAAAAESPLWRRGVVIYVAAVGEEIIFRLFVLSALCGLTMRLLPRGTGVPNRLVIWGSIGLSALAFAVAHLPAWRTAGPLDLDLALMVVTLNGLGGVLFGYVFVTRGIVAAMWAHAGADCAMLLIGPLT